MEHTCQICISKIGFHFGIRLYVLEFVVIHYDTLEIDRRVISH